MLWAILDKVVDDYAPVVEGLERDIEEVERRSSAAPRRRPSASTCCAARRPTSTAPCTRCSGRSTGLERGAYLPVGHELPQFFRDVNDHLKLVNEEVIAQRDLLAIILQANMAVISVEQNEIGVRQNETTKQLTLVATIFLPLSFVAGFFGMNFGWLTDHITPLWAFLLYGVGSFAASLAALLYLVPPQRPPRPRNPPEPRWRRHVTRRIAARFARGERRSGRTGLSARRVANPCQQRHATAASRPEQQRAACARCSPFCLEAAAAPRLPEPWDQPGRGGGPVGAVGLAEHVVELGFLDVDASHQRRQQQDDAYGERHPGATDHAEPGGDQQQPGVGRVANPSVWACGDHRLARFDLDGRAEVAAQGGDRPGAKREAEPQHDESGGLRRRQRPQRLRRPCGDRRSDRRSQRERDEDTCTAIPLMTTLAPEAFPDPHAEFEQRPGREGDINHGRHVW